MNFERGALAFVGALVAILVMASFTHPLAGVTVAPRAALSVAESMSSGGPVPPATPRSARRPKPVGDPYRTSARKLSDLFATLDYTLESVGSGSVRVPRLFLASLPADLAEIRETKARKALFFQAVLPLILQVNEEIREDRQRLWRLSYRRGMGRRLDALDRLWLAVMAERYGVERIMLNASGDWGPSDPATLHHVILELRKRGHTQDTIETLFYNNPCYFLGQCANWEQQPTRPKEKA